jgi:hypothetical protein
VGSPRTPVSVDIVGYGKSNDKGQTSIIRQMPIKPRYSIKKYIFLIVLSMTVAFVIVVAMLSIIGFPCQGILRIIVVWFPLCIFLALYGFYKGLVKYYGLKEDGKKGDSKSKRNKEALKGI